MTASPLILVTGGTGYIGSHTCVELMAAGFQVAIVDNLSNSKRAVLERIRTIAGKAPIFFPVDVRDGQEMDKILAKHRVAAVIHFAGLKAVNESVRQPLQYYKNNVAGTVSLCQAMRRHEVRSLVFSSSAAVYGDPQELPVREGARLAPNTPYGRSKVMTEEILHDLAASEPNWRISILRYFNPIGAHASGIIGEDSNANPTNLMPLMTQVAAGRVPRLKIFGSDYGTHDGTGIRDYIHVVDLARGHVAALRYLQQNAGVCVVNLGTGKGYSVLDVVAAFEKATGRSIEYDLEERRYGDIETCYADPTLAYRLFGWKAELGMERMCLDCWRWQSRILSE